MLINIIAVGTRMPSWVNTGFKEYAKRMPRNFTINLIEIPMAKRSKNYNAEQIKQQECHSILSAIPSGNLVIALDKLGKTYSSTRLAKQLDSWQNATQQLGLLIGGPDGLSTECLDKAQQKWSLSPLTLPHPLVRIVVAEQLYRAWSILQNHPYHRD